MANKPDDKPSVFDALDDAATAMLEKAKASDNLADAAKVFSLVAQYAENRAKALPQAKPRGTPKFDRIKKQFHGGQRAANGSAGLGGGPAPEASADDEPAGSA